ncbi:MAG: two-component system, OmpR family, sensor histidine kinase ResE [Solirubrobacterales bacterium]|nr:two-component system, OmpR family, sensor histidine kinase ResE [Solirubrobacterales bacterium]
MARSIRNLGLGRRNPFGVRLYLAFAFAGVALITAGIVYLLVSESGSQEADERLDELASGRTIALANEVEAVSPGKSQDTLDVGTGEDFSAWVFDVSGNLITASTSQGFDVDEVESGRRAVAAAQDGEDFVEPLTGGTTVVATPVRRDGIVDGVVLARAARPSELQEAIDAVRGDRITALLVALVVAVAISFLIASAITSRIKKLADSAAKISQGQLDRPLEGTGGRDEISELGRALETMRAALRQTFEALRSERDRLSAIFDALGDAVMVVGPDGTVRFSNPAARPLIYADGKVAATLIPWLRRASRTGTSEHDGLRIGERVYAMQAREIPAEGAVLTVVRDRTDELRRELAEREFVSNAAHELRNPLAGISGAVEVLRGGAKDDKEAREHFLRRLEQDTERITRLTDSLLTLARIESVGESGPEVLDVAIACEEAAQAFVPPDGIGFELEVEPDLAAQGDRVLLRQVLIGLLGNAFKHSSAPGLVTLRASRATDEEVLIEVTDTGSGIPPDEVDRIFERFFRGTDSREKEGFGLGLSIAKRMVDVMGGEIGVSSEVGKGSDFWVRLPAAKPAATPVA